MIAKLIKILQCVIFFSYCLLSTRTHAESDITVWDVLRGQFALNHELAQPAVQAQLRWLLNHPNYLQSLAYAKPYMYHIVSEIKKRQLPGELALVPMIESAFNPFAYSVAGAAGLWQLMPGTANDLGVKQDWWFDDRRNICTSTRAALNYFVYLNKHLNNDWLLTVAAYDAGEGGVLKAVKHSGQRIHNVDFWTLPLPNETKIYVPRLLALAEIIQHPERYGIMLPDILHEPYFTEVHLNSDVDLNHMVRLAGISNKELIKLNPGYNHWNTVPYQAVKLLIPANKAIYFNQSVTQPSQDDGQDYSSGTRHQVQDGDTIESIAQRYFTTPKQVVELNHLTSAHLINGAIILIPHPDIRYINPPSQSSSTTTPHRFIMSEHYKVIHIVQPGDNMQKLVKKYRVPADNILSWNKLASANLSPGEQLVIWRQIGKLSSTSRVG